MASVNGKLIISEILCFLQNEIKSKSKDDIITSCTKFYSNEEIEFEKTKFFDAIGVRTSGRRGVDQATKDVSDIIDKMISLDNDNAVVPTFVAADLSRIPRINNGEDGEASLQQILASMFDLKKSFKHLKTNMVTNESLKLALDSQNDSALPGVKPLGPQTPTRRRLLPEHSTSPRPPPTSSFPSFPPSAELVGLNTALTTSITAPISSALSSAAAVAKVAASTATSTPSTSASLSTSSISALPFSTTATTCPHLLQGASAATPSLAPRTASSVSSAASTTPGTPTISAAQINDWSKVVGSKKQQQQR